MDTPLPISEIIYDIKSKLEKGNTLILQAPPGAGKSTLLPASLLNETWLGTQRIILMQPRRLAAKTIASRIAELIGEEVGQTIGYRVRFESKISNKTKLEVVTEGVLTRMLQTDNTMQGVGLVIFDEFHERSINSDLALALCREVQQVIRADLRILIMSATLNTKLIKELLGNPPLIESKGRQFPVEISYHDWGKSSNIIIETASIVRKAVQEQLGDILVFLPGKGEINKVFDILSASANDWGVEIFKLYGELSLSEQKEAILPHPKGKRKIVLATNIAETSLTIEGVKVVVDSGLTRVSRFDSRSGLSKLETVRITADAATQRAGRAGRITNGYCYRLWNRAINEQLAPNKTPEILEADLAPLLLELSMWGIKEVNTITWITPPPPSAIQQAKELLLTLGAIDEQFSITLRGKELLKLPTHPRIAHLLLEGKQLNISSLACDVAALLEEKDPLPSETSSNIALRVEVLRKWRKREYSSNQDNLNRIEKLSHQWRKQMDCLTDNSIPNYYDIGVLIAIAYPDRIAMQKEDELHKYKLISGKQARLNLNDELDREKWLAIAQLDAGFADGKIYLAAPLLLDSISHLIKKQESYRWDNQKEQLLSHIEYKIGELVIKTQPLDVVDPTKKLYVLIDVVRKNGLQLFQWTEEALELQARILSLNIWRPELTLPNVSETWLIENIEDWLELYIGTVKQKEDFKKIDFKEIILGLFNWEQLQILDSLAPTKIKVPSGFEVKLSYSVFGEDPVLSVRLQEMFGLIETPTVNERRTKVKLHLLTPGYKPVQVTQDLKSFWKNTYPEVRKELRMRYPKHHWPEDPWTAEAIRGVKKKF